MNLIQDNFTRITVSNNDLDPRVYVIVLLLVTMNLIQVNLYLCYRD